MLKIVNGDLCSILEDMSELLDFQRELIITLWKIESGDEINSDLGIESIIQNLRSIYNVYEEALFVGLRVGKSGNLAIPQNKLRINILILDTLEYLLSMNVSRSAITISKCGICFDGVLMTQQKLKNLKSLFKG